MIEKIRALLLKKININSFLGKIIDKFFTKEIITYLIFGVLTTLVNWLVYTLMVKYLNLNITLSNAIAWICAVVFAFITNKLLVFESKSKKLSVVIKELLSFFASRALTGVFEIFGVPFLVKIGLNQMIFGVEGAFSKLIVSVLVIILNYIFSKLIIFRKRKGV